MDEHWSLCVIANAHLFNNDEAKDSDAVFQILIFDSLQYHRKLLISYKICNWFNIEWHRLNKIEDVGNVINAGYFKVCSPMGTFM